MTLVFLRMWEFVVSGLGGKGGARGGGELNVKRIESGAEVSGTMKLEAPFGGRESIVGEELAIWTCPY